MRLFMTLEKQPTILLFCGIYVSYETFYAILTRILNRLSFCLHYIPFANDEIV